MLSPRLLIEVCVLAVSLLAADEDSVLLGVQTMLFCHEFEIGLSSEAVNLSA